MTLTPLGDQAVLAYLPDEAAAVRFAAAVRAAAPPWLQDVVPAYASAGVFFDADRASLREVEGWLRALAPPQPDPEAGRFPAPLSPSGRGAGGEGAAPTHAASDTRVEGLPLTPNPSPRRGEGDKTAPLSPREAGRGVRFWGIPVCYDFQLDLARVADHTGLSAERVIALHTAAEYTVYAVGFVPGFPYLGYLPEPLCGVPRLASPRVKVEAGSVGLTGRQTGLYPLARPGGWNILGRTPLVVVDVADGFFPLRVGDRVRFARIDADEFRRLDGQRLT